MPYPWRSIDSTRSYVPMCPSTLTFPCIKPNHAPYTDILMYHSKPSALSQFLVLVYSDPPPYSVATSVLSQTIFTVLLREEEDTSKNIS